jgi:hypothetical protein
LKLLPTLADYSRGRALQLGLPLSTYFGVLLWNFSSAPRKMKPEPAAAAFARVHVPCSVRPRVWGVSRDMIRKSGLTANSLVEALVAEDRRGSQAGLWIRARQS